MGEGAIAILPLGATEQHGPHLPVETDSIIARYLAEQVVGRLQNEIDILLLPTQTIGYSPEHLDFSGTKSLAYGDAIDQWISIGQTMSERGIRKFLMLNAHGGNSPLLTIVAQELRVRFDMLAVATSWTRFIKNVPNISASEQALGIHGGQTETSVMLALEPKLVRIEKAEDFSSLQDKLASEYQHLRAYGPHAFGWKMADLNPVGVVGNAGAATVEMGEILLETAIEGLVELLHDIDRFDIDEVFAGGDAR